MIQMLPLLPPDWGTWKWDEGNLSATTEQTQQSHNTLLEKGLCANFSRFVWNDIVDLTANALDIAGIGWDSKYGNVESCKISEHMGALMANKFNGVAININRLGLFKWKWEVNSKDPGYLGRPHVYGASTHGSKADNIYAWYILELTDRLNWFLSILKDEASFAEQNSVDKSRMIIESKLASLVTAHSRSYENILSSSLSKARTLRVAPHESVISGNILTSTELLTRDVSVFSSELSSNSSIDAVSRMIYTLSIRVASLFVSSNTHAVLNDKSTIGCLSHSHKSTSSVFALIEAGIKDLLFNLREVSHQISQINASPNIILQSYPIIESLDHSILTSSRPQPIFTIDQLRSITSSVLDGMEGNYLAGNPIATSYANSEIILKRIGALTGSLYIPTTPFGLISSAVSSAGRFSKSSRFSIFAKPKMTVSKSAHYFAESNSYINDDIKLLRSASATMVCRSGAKIETFVSTPHTVGLTQNEHHIRSKTATALGATRCVDTSANTAAVSAVDPEVKSSISQRFESDDLSSSMFDARLVQAPSTNIGPEVHIISQSSCSLAMPIPTLTGSESTSSCFTHSKINATDVQNVVSGVCAQTAMSCRMESAWYPPVWINGGLWIRQSNGVAVNERGELVIT